MAVKVLFWRPVVQQIIQTVQIIQAALQVGMVSTLDRPNAPAGKDSKRCCQLVTRSNSIAALAQSGFAGSHHRGG